MKVNINCDGGSRGNPGPAACAFVVSDENDTVIFQKGFDLGEATNNQAEYQAVIESLKWLKESNLQATQINYRLDSELVVKQINRVYKIKDAIMLQKNQEVNKLISAINIPITFSYIPRAQNSRADSLVNQTLDSRI